MKDFKIGNQVEVLSCGDDKWYSATYIARQPNDIHVVSLNNGASDLKYIGMCNTSDLYCVRKNDEQIRKPEKRYFRKCNCCCCCHRC